MSYGAARRIAPGAVDYLAAVGAEASPVVSAADGVASAAGSRIASAVAGSAASAAAVDVKGTGRPNKRVARLVHG